MLKSLTLLTTALIFLSHGGNSHTLAEWKSKTIYQVLTDRFWRTDDSTKDCPDLHKYCGGTYKGLIKKLDYIKGMGFDAIWISPVIKNTPGGYHGYWAKDKYDVNEFFGIKQDLLDLGTELKKRDMWLMVDVVGNHMGYVSGGGFDFTSLSPFNKPEHFHNWCEVNPGDNLRSQWRMEHCRLDGLPDLNQDNEFVRSELVKWIKWMVDTYKIDGIRIDTVPFVAKDFWSEFTKSAGVYSVGEVYDRRTPYVGDYQGHVDGLLNYPLYFTINDFFKSDKSGELVSQKWKDINKYFSDPHALGLFIDNHDNPRFLYQNNRINRLRNAVIFTLFSQGIPIIYYGTEQNFNGANDPFNREALWPSLDPTKDTYLLIKKMIAFRKAKKVWGFEQVERYYDASTYVFSRGDVLILSTNNDQDYEVTMSYLPFYEGQTVCDQVAQDGACYTVVNGVLKVKVSKGEPVVLAPKEKVVKEE